VNDPVAKLDTTVPAKGDENGCNKVEIVQDDADATALRTTTCRTINGHVIELRTMDFVVPKAARGGASRRG
jgi:hypothetical protein